MKKILQYGKAYKNYFLPAVLCTVAATVLSLVTPGKLSDLTNQITDGIASGMDFRLLPALPLFCLPLTEYPGYSAWHSPG